MKLGGEYDSRELFRPLLASGVLVIRLESASVEVDWYGLIDGKLCCPDGVSSGALGLVSEVSSTSFSASSIICAGIKSKIRCL